MSDARRFLFAIGIGVYSLALSEYLSAPREHTGRWSWLPNLAIEKFGEYGAVYLWIALGTFLILKAFSGTQKAK